MICRRWALGLGRHGVPALFHTLYIPGYIPGAPRRRAPRGRIGRLKTASRERDTKGPAALNTMENKDLLQLVAKIRRDIPRNPDVLLAMRELERLALSRGIVTSSVTLPQAAPVTLPPPVTLPASQPVTLHKCPFCEARRSADAARVRRHRQKAAAHP